MRSIAIYLAILLLTAVPLTSRGAPPLPNIVFILVDDLGYGDLGCYGQERIRTPRLDQLADEGMRFTQFYAGSTVCAPSRCTLMTGKHTGHCSVRGNVDVLMSPEEKTLAEVLDDAGYFTACVGKWGIGHPPPADDPQQHGFDHFYGYLSMWHAHNAYPEFLWRNGRREPIRNVVRNPREHYKEGQEQLTGVSENKLDFAGDKFTDEALRVLADAKQPFFLFVSYTAPHANNEAEALGAVGVESPDEGPYAGKDWPAAERAKAAVISRTDRDVGRIVDKIDELGLGENTLVVFTSDNGPHSEGGIDPEFFDSSGPLRGIKRDLYEGGIRVPMITRWTGETQPGSESDHVSAFWDVLPTCAELTGQSSPRDTDGISFLPALRGKSQPEHDYLYWEFHEKSSKQAIRQGKWKAVRTSPDAAIELYDLSQDVGEQRNVAAEHADVVKQMQALMKVARNDEQTWPLQTTAEEIPF